jgi:hypothetical protein
MYSDKVAESFCVSTTSCEAIIHSRQLQDLQREQKTNQFNNKQQSTINNQQSTIKKNVLFWERVQRRCPFLLELEQDVQ